MKEGSRTLHPYHIAKLERTRLPVRSTRKYSLHHISVFFVYQGSVRFRIGKREAVIAEGEGFFFPKQNVVTLEAMSNAEYAFLSARVGAAQLSPLSFGPFSAVKRQSMQALFDDLFRETAADSRFSIEASVALYRFFILLPQTVSVLSLDESKQDAEKKCLPALLYIQKHWTSDIEVDKLSALCGYGVTHFSRLFREATGCTTKEYIRMLRMKAAIRYLYEMPSLSTRSLASLLGYEYHYFLLLFRRTYGMSPDVYRKQRKEPSSQEKM